MHYRKIKLQQEIQGTSLPTRQVWLRLQIPQACMITFHNKMRAKQVVSPPFQSTYNSNKLPVHRIVITFSRTKLVRQIFNWLPMLPAIRWLHQRRSHRVIRSINPYFPQFRLIENLQHRRRRQRHLKLCKSSSFNPSPRELNALPSELSQRVGYRRKVLNKATIEVS